MEFIISSCTSHPIPITSRILNLGFVTPPSNTVYNVVVVTGSVSPTTNNFIIALDVLGAFSTALICSAMPRFIIGVREMYDHEVRKRMQGIDSGFGFSRNAPDEFKESGIAFIDESRTILGDANKLGAVRQDAH